MNHLQSGETKNAVDGEKRNAENDEYIVLSLLLPTSLLVVVLGALSTDPALQTDESFPFH